MAGTFRPITLKVNLILVVSLAVGIGLVVASIASLQSRMLRAQSEEALTRQADLLYQAIKTAMLRGNAPDAVVLLRNIESENPLYRIRLTRTDGTAAFSDNSTIRTVNGNLGKTAFEEVPERPDLGPLLENPENPNFKAALGPDRLPLFRETFDGSTWFSRYRALINLPVCTACHGSDHTFRGVIRISFDPGRILRDQRFMLWVSAGAWLALVTALVVFLTRYLHAAVIMPVKRIGEVCRIVSEGRFDEKVSLVNNDEIGVLGATINGMIDGLYERFELSKYVSHSTLQSIRNREKGEKVRLSVLFSDIRSFTAFAESNPPETVVRELNSILGIQAGLVHEHGGDVDKFVGDAVLALFTGADHELRACRTALAIQKALAPDATGPGLSVGIGVNVGEVILGMIGSEDRADYTVIGDHVNLASRLCDAAGGGEILVSSGVRKAAGDSIAVRGPYGLTVKGKREKQRVYFLTGLGEAGDGGNA